MPSATDIPVEVWLDNILPNTPVADILRLGCTNRFFYLLTSDETFWHRKLEADYNFSGADTARTTGFKLLYKRLRNPKLFVWGDASQSRLGISNLPARAYRDGVPTPTQLSIPGVRVVSIVAGGMSFHAIDDRGSLYVWGALDGQQFALRGDGYSESGKIAERPTRLLIWEPIRTISCGRLHAAALDVSNLVWNFNSWGRPFRLISDFLNRTSPETTPIQVECGWSFTSVLTASGDVLVWWPTHGTMWDRYLQKNAELDAVEETKAFIGETRNPHNQSESVTGIKCHVWDLVADPVRLPPIPVHDLPEIAATGHSDEVRGQETKLIKIAGMDNHIIGLTNKGHVLRYSRLQGVDAYRRGRWEYLPYFSDLAKVRECEPFTPDAQNHLGPPSTMLITHISAHFHTFIAYSTGPESVVLMGKFSTENELPPPPDETKPIIIPSLQYKSVISVVLGDYHYGALTSTGKLYTWGAFSKGALGLGHPKDIEPGQPGGFANDQQRRAVIARGGEIMVRPPDVNEPTEVRFDHGSKNKRETFCFAATASGWHTGALVIDLDPKEEHEEEDEELRIPGTFPSGDASANQPEPEPPTVPHGIPIFRIGLAGARGRGTFWPRVHRGGAPQ
ncbi:RCC1/BLIP-II [Panus rudis PR-1116 ss-1]|nr:RCC1/BLIP-II [Panus rudis PR-1116 ss-1]